MIIVIFRLIGVFAIDCRSNQMVFAIDCRSNEMVVVIWCHEILFVVINDAKVIVIAFNLIESYFYVNFYVNARYLHTRTLSWTLSTPIHSCSLSLLNHSLPLCYLLSHITISYLSSLILYYDQYQFTYFIKPSNLKVLITPFTFIIKPYFTFITNLHSYQQLQSIHSFIP